MFHLSSEVMSVEPWSMMWISLDDATEAQSNTDSALFLIHAGTAWLRLCLQA